MEQWVREKNSAKNSCCTGVKHRGGQVRPDWVHIQPYHCWARPNLSGHCFPHMLNGDNSSFLIGWYEE